MKWSAFGITSTKALVCIGTEPALNAMQTFYPMTSIGILVKDVGRIIDISIASSQPVRGSVKTLSFHPIIFLEIPRKDQQPGRFHWLLTQMQDGIFPGTIEELSAPVGNRSSKVLKRRSSAGDSTCGTVSDYRRGV